MSPKDHFPLWLRSGDAPLPEYVALLAGSGEYPQLCARRMQALGIQIHLVALDEAFDKEFLDSFPFHSRTFLPIGHLGKILKVLKKASVTHVISAGQIRPQKLFQGLHLDLKAFCLLRKLRRKNAATIFGAIADEIEALGIHILDARSFMEEDLAPKGIMTQASWELSSYVLEHGIHIAQEIANLDIGQGVVVCEGTVLCVESFDGTDAMLQYAGRFSAKPKLFVKSSKSAQDFRFDVPVFGMKTLEHMRQSNILYAALEAERTLILHKKNVLAKANEWGIQIYGYSTSQNFPS